MESHPLGDANGQSQQRSCCSIRPSFEEKDLRWRRQPTADTVLDYFCETPALTHQVVKEILKDSRLATVNEIESVKGNLLGFLVLVQ